MDRVIGMVLRVGVVVSALVVFSGGVLYLAACGDDVPAYKVFRGEPADLKTASGILADVLSLRAAGLIQFGLLLLIATPVVRVAFSIVAFGLERDWIYVVVTVIVLSILIYSISGGRL
ncbi:MAG: DUF1634 domain-containing protein [Chloroflexota bacterium]